MWEDAGLRTELGVLGADEHALAADEGREGLRPLLLPRRRALVDEEPYRCRARLLRQAVVEVRGEKPDDPAVGELKRGLGARVVPDAP